MAAEAKDDFLSKGKKLLDELGSESPLDDLGNLTSEGASVGLSTDEIAAGLKEALRVGTETVVGQLGQLDGFSADPTIHIPLPESLGTVQDALERVGLLSLLDDLVVRLNRTAETATPKAKALFWQAITDMTLDDVKRIYEGPDDAATHCFQGRMSKPLADEMRPVVDDSLAEVGAVQAYDRAIGEYENLPLVPDVKADLTQHVLDAALDGLFHYVAQEEAAIRKDPAKRTTEILRRVFGAS